mgnify:CR=1 FL=1
MTKEIVKRHWDDRNIMEKLQSVMDSPSEVVSDSKGFMYVGFKDKAIYKKTLRGSFWDRLAPHRLPKNKETRISSGKFDFITAIRKLKDIKPLNGFYSCTWRHYYPVKILVTEDSNFQMYCGGAVINLGNLDKIEPKQIEHRLHLLHTCLEVALYELSFTWRERKDDQTNNLYLQNLLANNDEDLKVKTEKYLGE